MKSLSRRELYDLVWSEPVSKVAVQFGLSDVGLKKACKRHKIPTPGLGYWARVNAGQRVGRMAFPALAKRDEHLETVHFNVQARSPEVVAAREFAAVQKAERKPYDTVDLKHPPFEYVRLPHPVVRETARRLRAGVLVEGGVAAQEEGECGVKVAAGSVERAISLLHALVCEFKRRTLTLEPRGKYLSVSDGTEKALIHLLELSRLTPHIPTSEEREADKQARQRLKRERGDFFFYNSPWPEKDRIWSGKFKVEILGYGSAIRRSWSDGTTQTVEGMLSQIADGVETYLVFERQKRVEQEAKALRWQKLAHRRELLAKRHAREGKRHAFLDEMVAMALRIQQLDTWLRITEASSIQPDLTRMVTWAKTQRDALQAKLEAAGLDGLLRERQLFPDPASDPLLDPDGDPPPERPYGYGYTGEN